MTKIKFSDDIAIDSIADKKLATARQRHYNNTKRQVNHKAFRVYTVNNKDYTAKGYWRSDNKLFKDRINFVYTSDYHTAKKTAYKLLTDTKEICIAVEDILLKRLYIIYRDKIEVLKIKYSYKTIDKRQAINQVKRFTAINGGATVEIKQSQYIVSSYK